MSANAQSAPAEAWQRLREDLVKIRSQYPDALTGYPTPNEAPRPSPVRITLAATAEAVAAQLHQAHGEYVALTLGALPYPPHSSPPARRPAEMFPLVDPTELLIELDSPLVVPSGHTARHAALITNKSTAPVRIRTNGHVFATVIDSRGEPVGGAVGGRHLMLVVFTISPQATQSIPLIVGTTSYTPDLGYAVPPGHWQLTIPLVIAERGTQQSPPLSFTVT